MPPIAMLNRDFDFNREAPPEVRNAFDGDRIVCFMLPEGTRFWRWADFPPEESQPVSPWWLPIRPEPLPVGTKFWPLQEVERQAKQRQGGLQSIFRSGVAVLPEWNEMTRMVIVGLRVNVVGFAGPAAMQQVIGHDGVAKPVYLGAGFWQLYIPNLTFDALTLCDAEAELARYRLDPEFWLSPAPTYTGSVSLSPKVRRLLKLLGLPEDSNTD